MKVIENIEQNTNAWLDLRKGRITGSKLADIVVKRGTGKKIGFYELIADKLSIAEEAEDAMERGHRLEGVALDLFTEQTGKKLTRGVFCVSDDNDYIALSPDALIGSKGKFDGAVEVKCLSAAKHLMAYFEQKVPSEYEFQVLQYFIVNDKLKTLYFVFYDPRITAKPIHWLEIKRENMEEDIATYKQYQIDTLKEIETLTAQLAF